MELVQGLFSEIATGLAGGAIVALLGLGVTLFRQKQIERRYPVRGDYLSFFEDRIDGKNVVSRSRSTFSQRGKALHINTRMSDGRSWTCEGSILPGGHISGVYSADAVYDEGVGSFYLKVTDDNNLDGMWNGYDNTTRKTESGRYWFKRVINCTIRDAVQHDVNDILHTAADAFGNGYMPDVEITNNGNRFAIVAEVKGEFAGFCLGHVLDKNGVRAFVGKDLGTPPDDLRHADENGRLGTVRTVAVRPKYRGHGIGSALLSSAETELVKRRATCVLVPAWTVGDEVFLRHILEDNDYSLWASNADYWKSACEARSFKCVRFDGQCNCGVAFYRKGRLRDVPGQAAGRGALAGTSMPR